MKQHSSAVNDNQYFACIERWGCGSPRSAENLLIEHLRRLQSDKVLHLDKLGEDAAIQLPCGYDTSITKEAV